MFERERQKVEQEIRAYCAEYDLHATEEINWARIPFSGEWGISTSFFQMAADEARAGKDVVVPQRAQEIAQGVADHLGSPAGFSRVEAVRGYLNLYFEAGEFSRRVIDSAINQGSNYGRGKPTGERAMVEFSQPNTHKPLHVGHLRNTIFGAAIANILEFAGYEIVRANYPGDSGLHVIKWMWTYLKNHKGEEPSGDKIRWMGDIYTEANRLLDENPELEGEMRALFAQWEEKDPEVMALWRKTRQWSLEGFEEAYERLGIHFDKYYFQSELEEEGKRIVDELIERGIAVDLRPADAVIVRIDDLLGLEKEKYRVMVALRSDGTALYSTWDLALALRKFRHYDLDKSIYIVDVRQSLHFQQLFKTLEIAGYDIAEKCVHVPYEVVTLPGNVTMKSREGTVVLLEDFLREAVQRALAVVQEKNPELPEEIKEKVAEEVALGAIKYPMLARDNTKVATFDWESALDFTGQAAVYIQYAHVRANSILKKFDQPLPENLTPQYDFDPKEIELIEMLSRLGEQVQRSAQEYKTLPITNLAYETARAFNDFYNQCPVLQAEPQVRDFRIRLVAAAKQALANELGLLGITAPDVM